MRYPGPDMQLLLKSVGSPDTCMYAEIRTRIPDTISWDYHFEHARNTPVTFTVKSTVLKEAIDDLEWPGSSIQIQLQPDPPAVTFKGEGHGDLQGTLGSVGRVTWIGRQQYLYRWARNIWR